MTCSGLIPALTRNVVSVKRPMCERWWPDCIAVYSAFMHGGKAAMTTCLGISSRRSFPFLSISSCFRRSARTTSSSGSVRFLVWRRFSTCFLTSSSRRRATSFFVSVTLPFTSCLLTSFHSFSWKTAAFLM